MPRLSPPPSSFGGFCPRSHDLGFFFAFSGQKKNPRIQAHQVHWMKSDAGAFPLIFPIWRTPQDAATRYILVSLVSASCARLLQIYRTIEDSSLQWGLCDFASILGFVYLALYLYRGLYGRRANRRF